MPDRPSLQLRDFARHLRTHQTDCEHLLWQRLRARQIAELKFRRQFPCPPYVLDFYCVELQLAIELDGGQHYEIAGQIHDRRRTNFLREKGIEVLRFSNLEVIEQMEDVLEQIIRVAKALRLRS
ncbi:endonuclease domain-containing protein [Pseudomonas vancouverensis]|uniref:Endonuclease domain-containing protein n=1 Tax=Pseudomonas vancouverensis TaxID=95300 RepID=A0A1H2P9E5_PSEVA|nr:endonuclease domain-containing protein [Pseudomonas vancouverensis]KAB0490101.1 endonuclease domain-containing protein [Pseudomonas vancouverensis]TDB58795.1 endonuclease domain-containing protein [Pseudomonas vancouverensis]SDV14294.1 Very-short-patch-repair endonuclease [Pseudomonas vancouverensis]